MIWLVRKNGQGEQIETRLCAWKMEFYNEWKGKLNGMLLV